MMRNSEIPLKMAMRLSKYAAEKNSGISEHMLKLHERFLQALNLEIKCSDKRNRRWQSTDIEIQKLAVRSISAFVDCVSPSTSQRPLVKSYCNLLYFHIDSQIIKVPVGWEALAKLVNWSYSDEVQLPSSGCSWDNMDVEQKLREVKPYVELCWLAEFWFLEDVRKNCFKVVESCLKSGRDFSIKIIHIAADFSQWDLAEIAANYMAPLYPSLRGHGDLEALDDELVDLVRVTYVQFSQEYGSDHAD